MAHLSHDFAKVRKRMVAEQLAGRDIIDERVLKVMGEIPRQIFVDEALSDQAYQDHPLAIGLGQTISQPYIVASMTQALNLKGTEKVLEIGTGCGYQTAVLANLVAQVYTIERIKDLALKARRHLKELNLRNIVMRAADGTQGWPEAAPFDAILVAAGSPAVPAPLVAQLAEGGRLVVPVGSEDSQNLIRIIKKDGRAFSEDLGPCRFVKLVGRHAWKKQRQAGDGSPKLHSF